MRKTKFIRGFLSALEAVGSIGAVSKYPALKGTDLERLRGDVGRVGLDFQAVIRREDGKASSKAARQASNTTARP